MPDDSDLDVRRPSRNVAWRLTKWICCAAICLSVLSCVLIATLRSEGLTSITVTALDARDEPRDHGIPLIRQHEALPDYEVVVVLNEGQRLALGARPNASAVDGLTWHLSDPVPLTRIASIRLQDRDHLASDAVAEVQHTGATTLSGNYRFTFTSARSLGVGVQAFFATPIGITIAIAFGIAVLIMLLSAVNN